jgi:hypothetical protein
MTSRSRGRLGDMAVSRRSDGLIEPLDVMNEFDVSLDVRTSRAHVARFEMFGHDDVLEVSAKTIFHPFGEKCHDRTQRAFSERVVGGGNGGAEIAAGWLQSGVGRALSGTMHTNDRFKEIPVRQLFPLGAQRTNDERLVECGANLGLISTPDRSRVSSVRCAALTTGPSRLSQCASTLPGAKKVRPNATANHVTILSRFFMTALLCGTHTGGARRRCERLRTLFKPSSIHRVMTK